MINESQLSYQLLSTQWSVHLYSIFSSLLENTDKNYKKNCANKGKGNIFHPVYMYIDR